MSKLESPGVLNLSPAALFFHSPLPASLYSQPPATHSMISGAPVLNVSCAGRMTPMDFLVPSANWMEWLTHLPSKYTLAWVVTVTPSILEVVMWRNFTGAVRQARQLAGAANENGAEP